MKISGIYQIKSKIKPERIYIGSSINIGGRWWLHLFRLKRGIHHSIKLQNHFNKYRESDLQFSILLGCEKEDLIKVEQYFIDSYNPWFNICKIAGNSMGRKASKETIEKKKKYRHTIEAKNKISEIQKKSILQFDKNMKLIKEWDSTKSASKELLINNGHICSCMRGNRKSIGGFIWQYKVV